MRAATVRINDVSGVAGFVQPNDSVDVLITHGPPDGIGAAILPWLHRRLSPQGGVQTVLGILKQRFGEGAAFIGTRSRLFAAVGNDFVAHLGAVIETAQTRSLNGGYVHEDILAAVIRLNKAITLGGIEPFHYTFFSH